MEEINLLVCTPQTIPAVCKVRFHTANSKPSDYTEQTNRHFVDHTFLVQCILFTGLIFHIFVGMLSEFTNQDMRSQEFHNEMLDVGLDNNSSDIDKHAAQQVIYIKSNIGHLR